jgi:Zn finger protein HypA/HybF involved in hydrogenase expression
LVSYEDLPQELAALKMDISRPTLTRIYNSALKKIAKAFVEYLAIEIEGGNIEFEKEWFKCNKCFKLIEGIENHKKCIDCESYGVKELIKINPGVLDKV